MTTDAQLEAFDDPQLGRVTSVLERKAYAVIVSAGSRGLTYDEAYALAFPFQPHRHAGVDSFRVAVRHLRERGLVMDSGRSRVSADTDRPQTVWVAGDDRDVVDEHRRAKLRKFPTAWLRDELIRREQASGSVTCGNDAREEQDYQPVRSSSSE